ncbi:MAG: acyl-CoA thioesterase, partial [Bacillota bacterium]|nr:acyl-CoA thioesterase [Bacillota bacterium]
ESPEEKQLFETAARRRELRLTRPQEVEPDFSAHDPVSAAHLSFESTTEVCFPSVTNDLGVAKAGWLLSVGDVMAGLSASRHAGTATVTAAVDAVAFPEPVHVGDIVELRTYLTRAFRTSMEVRAEVWKRRTPAALPERVTTIYYTYVAVDRDGRPTPVPSLTPKTPLDERLYESAGQRRQVRLASLQTFS